jgi:hypothetical protein
MKFKIYILSENNIKIEDLVSLTCNYYKKLMLKEKNLFHLKNFKKKLTFKNVYS